MTAATAVAAAVSVAANGGLSAVVGIMGNDEICEDWLITTV
jgi:hypothetical protein